MILIPIKDSAPVKIFSGKLNIFEKFSKCRLILVYIGLIFLKHTEFYIVKILCAT